jgi:hypothetical protein
MNRSLSRACGYGDKQDVNLFCPQEMQISYQLDFLVS